MKTWVDIAMFSLISEVDDVYSDVFRLSVAYTD